MKRKLMTPSVIASLMLVAGAAVAADLVSVSGGTMHFEGELVNATYAASIQPSDQVVISGQYRIAGSTVVGNTVAQIPFSIALNDCDPKVAAIVTVAFSGQSDITDNNLLVAISADNGTTANDVGIRTLDNISTALKPDGATFSTDQALVEGTSTLRFSMRYKATVTSVTPDQTNADTTFIMEYE